jgi:hypothetical protein
MTARRKRGVSDSRPAPDLPPAVEVPDLPR